jgi:hypothetical protein
MKIILMVSKLDLVQLLWQCYDRLFSIYLMILFLTLEEVDCCAHHDLLEV